VRGFVANTDYDWYDFLRGQAPLEEVNFWRPSGKSSALESGTPFFFKLKAPHYAIAGFGLFARASVTPATLAWEAFGPKNGAPNEAAMRARIEKYRQAPPAEHGDYEIGCLMISQPVFFAPGNWVEQPRDWEAQIVSGKGYDLAVGEGRRIWDACCARISTPVAGLPLIAAEPVERYGAPVLVKPRLGQGTFRVAVTDAYGRACAVTSEHSLPVLEAAHIKPFAEEGPHEVRNGLLLRSDVHRLFDRGYVTVTPDGRFEVSRRLREDFDNGKTYYALQGQRVHLPSRAADRPAPELLRWHNETKFKAA
jgi:putative restriction endonuclease